MITVDVSVEDAEGLIADLPNALHYARGWVTNMNGDKMSIEISFEEFKKIDARVGTITQVDRVPRTEKLYKILVDLGPLGVRQTVSSLVGYYEAEQLKGKRVIFLYNLKPSKFSGEVSQGMLLAAEQDDRLALLTIDREVPDGSRIT
jgi:methionine--tRNA ligase beta chain